MVPPPCGTPAWETHVAKQKKKRHAASLAKNIKKYLPMAARKIAAHEKTQARLIAAMKATKELSDRNRDVATTNREINRLYANLPSAGICIKVGHVGNRMTRLTQTFSGAVQIIPRKKCLTIHAGLVVAANSRQTQDRVMLPIFPYVSLSFFL